MKRFFSASLLSAALISLLPAQDISLVQAAEMVTKFGKEEKIEGRPMQEFFTVSALLRSTVPDKIEPTTVVWTAELKETPQERTSEATNAIFLEDGKKYRRVIQILNDQSIVIGKMYAEPRQMVVRPRIVPVAK